ncbi:MAG: exodeoxyribonuclease V subunit beta [Planctomycetes bacterium]|nr:exodeoxyribonuclease V subunit beta [Planctomycetota bacterium]
MSGVSNFAPDASLETGVTLIEASAGTGKTYTITTLVLKLLIEVGLSITQILVVTFTEAATAELRDRVRARLRAALLAYQGSWPAKDPWLKGFVEERQAAGEADGDVERIQAGLAEFDQATIATIHGFCMRMLQENAFESGIRFDAELMTSMRELIDEVAADFWTLRMSGLAEDLYRYLIGSKKGKSHLQITPEALQKLSQRAASNLEVPVLPDPVGTVEPVDSTAFQAATAAVATCFASSDDEVRGLIEDAVSKGVFNKSLTSLVEACFTGLDEWCEAPPQEPSFGLLYSPAMEISATALVGHKNKTKKKLPLPEHELFDLLDEVRALLNQHQRSLEVQAVKLNVELIDYARQQLDDRKQALGQQSFDDLLVLLSLALRNEETGPRLAEAIRDRFKAALIDEFQDTSPVQFGIFSTVFKDSESYLYLIGDPKQAIYAFRAADVYAYLRAAAEIEGDDRVTLGTNWRSDESLIRALGHVYSEERHADPFADERIKFVQVGSHYPDRLQPTSEALAPFRIRVATQPAKAPKKGPARYGKEELRDLLATVVPDDVSRLLNQGLEIDGKDLQPGDIAILVRTNKQALDLQRELRRRRIPSVLHGSSSVFESSEASELRLVLQAVLEPSRVSAVRTALATDLLGVHAAELSRLVEDPLGGSVPGEVRWDDRVESFRALRTLWEERGVVQMFRQLLDDYSVQDRVLSRVGGERSMTNLLHLTELLHHAASEEQLGAQGLTLWLERQLVDDEREKADSVQLRLESDDKALVLITIHKSKGLEYPVVLCPYLWDGGLVRNWDATYIRFHDPAHNEQLTLDVGSDHSEEALAAVDLDAESEDEDEDEDEDEFAPPTGRARSLALANHELQAENARLLYVALTRAKHHCTVYFAPVNEGETSPLGYLLLGGGKPELLGQTPAERSHERVAKAAERIAFMGPAEVLAELEALAAEAPAGLVSVVPIDDEPAPSYLPAQEEALELKARELTLSVDWNWRSTSYSALASQRHASPGQVEPEIVDRDAVSDEADTSPAPKESGDPIPLRTFPKGARCGNCLHKILELADFETLKEPKGEGPELVAKQLETFGFNAKRWSKTLHGALVGALSTPLSEADATLRLDALPRAQRLDELEFVFPVAGGLSRAGKHMTPTALAAVFTKHASPAVSAGYATSLGQLAFRPLQGFLRGFIDLVFEWKGRYYLADYKSNFLGETFGAYAPEHMREVMAEHHYFLQYHLYSVALHRYLRWRLKGYSYQEHFGGAYYLFLRGMSHATAATAGVFYDKPSEDLINALDALLEGAE